MMIKTSKISSRSVFFISKPLTKVIRMKPSFSINIKENKMEVSKMAALNPKCHAKGCQCATCSGVCSRCAGSGLCSDKICHSEHGMQNCPIARQEAELEERKG